MSPCGLIPSPRTEFKKKKLVFLSWLTSLGTGAACGEALRLWPLLLSWSLGFLISVCLLRWCVWAPRLENIPWGHTSSPAQLMSLLCNKPSFLSPHPSLLLAQSFPDLYFSLDRSLSLWAQRDSWYVPKKWWPGYSSNWDPEVCYGKYWPLSLGVAWICAQVIISAFLHVHIQWLMIAQ